MLFAFSQMVKHCSGELRQRMGPERRNALSDANDCFSCACPLVSDHGTTMLSSMVVSDLLSHEAKYAWVVQGPFVQTGLFFGNTAQVSSSLSPRDVSLSSRRGIA